MKLPLSPIDYYFYRRSLYTIQFVFEYEGHLDLGGFSRNLTQVASIIPALGSRIQIVSGDKIVLETGFSIPLRTQVFAEDPPVSIQSEDYLDPVTNIAGEPLVKVLVTHTPRKTFVGFSFSHMLGDGFSFFQFVKALSQICLGQRFEGSYSNARDLLQVANIHGLNSPSFFEATGYVLPRPPNSEFFVIEQIEFTSQRLSELKNQCKKQGFKVTSNDILMADLAKRFHQHIPLHENHFIIRCPVEYRSIFGLPLQYFGNAVRDAVARFHQGEVESLSLAEIAHRIRKAIDSVDKQNVIESLYSLDQLRLNHGIGIFEHVGCPGLLVSNLSKFPIKEIDFGLGHPAAFHHASLNPRLALILPKTSGVEVRFKRPVLQ